MNVAQHVLAFAVRLYQCTLSPASRLVFGPLAGCRFTPTCSQYALEAVRAHGALRGSWLAIKRIGRCHPWGSCGEDLVPPRRIPESRSSEAEGNARNPDRRQAGFFGTFRPLPQELRFFSDFTFRIWDFVVTVLRRRHLSPQGLSERR